MVSVLSLECELIIPGSTAFQCDSRPHPQGPACLQVPTTFQRSSASLRLCLMSIYTLRFLTQRRLSWQSTLPQGFCSGLHLGFHSLQWPSEGRILWSLSLLPSPLQSLLEPFWYSLFPSFSIFRREVNISTSPQRTDFPESQYLHIPSQRAQRAPWGARQSPLPQHVISLW